MAPPSTEVQIVSQLHFMIMAGVHTTRGLLTHVVQRLLHTPDLYRRLGEERGLVPIFVEESLRHDAPVQRTTRRCMRETEIGGIAMHPGDWIEVGIASGNRDEDVYDDPESFRLDRTRPAQPPRLRRRFARLSGSHPGSVRGGDRGRDAAGPGGHDVGDTRHRLPSGSGQPRSRADPGETRPRPTLTAPAITADPLGMAGVGPA